MNLTYAEEVLQNGTMNHYPIDVRVSIHTLKPFESTVNERFLRSYMGDAYDMFLSERADVIADYTQDPPVSAFPSDTLKDEIFSDLILPTATWAFVYQAIPFVNMKFGTDGMVFEEVEQSMSPEDIKKARDIVFQTAIEWGRRLSKRLQEEGFVTCEQTRNNWHGLILF